MASQNVGRAIDFGGPATYRIVVQGALSRQWHDRLAGFAIDTTRGVDGAARTTMVGQIRDQAELNGLLDILYGLHLAIIRVETLDAGTTPPRGSYGHTPC